MSNFQFSDSECSDDEFYFDDDKTPIPEKTKSDTSDFRNTNFKNYDHILGKSNHMRITIF